LRVESSWHFYFPKIRSQGGKERKVREKQNEESNLGGGTVPVQPDGDGAIAIEQIVEQLSEGLPLKPQRD
jgi:hypothetical protein